MPTKQTVYILHFKYLKTNKIINWPRPVEHNKDHYNLDKTSLGQLRYTTTEIPT